MIALRRLVADDWAAFKAIRLRALTTEPGAFFTSVAAAAARSDDDWRAMLIGEEQAVFGAFDDETLVGITAVFTDRDADPSGRTALFGMTWLDPGWRGQGFTHLYHAARIAWAKARGFALLTVGHRASNAASRRAILAAGFVPVGAQPHRWPDGAVEDDVLYELRLDA